MVCRLLGILSCVSLLTLAGCHMHSPYGYDGGGYAYPSNAGMMPPDGGSPYVNSPPIMNGSPGVFPGSVPYSSPPPAYPTPTPGSTIPYGSTNPTPSASNTTNNPRPIDKLPPESEEYPDTPPPKRAENINTPPVSSSTIEDEADFKSDQIGKPANKAQSEGQKWIEQEEKEDREAPSGNGAKKDTKVQRSGLTEEEADEFASPGAFDPGSDPFEAAQNTTNLKTSPFMHDVENNRWYRGIAEFDDEMQVWMIRYSADAGEEGPQGRITLAEHALLSTLRQGDIVLVDGTFDPAQTDRFDKPMFAIKHLKRLIATDDGTK